MTITIKRGDPIISHDGAQILARFAYDFDLRGQWLEVACGDPMPATCPRDDAPNVSRSMNVVQIWPDFHKPSVRVFRASESCTGSGVFRDKMFMRPDADPSATPAGIAKACEVILGLGFLRGGEKDTIERIMQMHAEIADEEATQ
jgi:hypothetical protein